jgi:hypothetical protein
MTTQNMSSPIPLRADPAALARAERRSLVRAITAMALASRPTSPTADKLVKAWDDPMAERILKSAQHATGTADFPQLQAIRVLPSLAPSSAASQLLALATTLDLSGVGTIKIPTIPPTTQTPVSWIGEDKPAPVIALSLGSVILGPTKKLLVLAAVSGEMAAASAANAETIVGRALEIAAGRALDSTLFSNAAATAVAPAGLLSGMTPLTASTSKGAAGLAADLGALTGAIGAAGIATGDVVFVTTPDLQTRIRVLVGPAFANTVLSSPLLAAKSVVAVAPAALACGYEGSVEIDVSSATTIHMEDTAPADIVSTGGTPAYPTRSAFQDFFSVIRARCRAAYVVVSGGISLLAGADW